MIKSRGFTIVELLIVIVVIGILAAIAILAYTGIQDRAKVATVQSDLENVVKTMESYKFSVSTSEQYPVDLATAALKSSTGTSYQYTVNNSVSPATYCVTATNGTNSYYVSSTSTKPTSGGCPGHGVGGVAAVTNLSTNPSFELNGIGWNGFTFGTGGNGTLSRQTTGGISGTSFWRGAFTTAASGGAISVTSQVASGPDLAAGQVVNYSLYVRPSVTSMVNAQIDFYIRSSVTFVSNVPGSFVSAPANQWTRVSISATVPATATTGRIALGVSAANNFGSNGTVDIDAAMMTIGSTLYNYADGDSANWAWTGTAHASTSTGPAL